MTSRPAQAKFHAAAATNQPDGQITQKSVHPLRQKYSAGGVGQISDLIPPVSPDERGARDRHERAVGCGGRGLRETYAQEAYGEVVWS